MMIPGKKLRRSSRSAAASFVAGLGALASIWPTAHTIRYPHASSFDALSRDTMKIGSDMSRVVERENERLKKK